MQRDNTEWLKYPWRPIVVTIGLVQLYSGYDCEQVTILASRIPDTIVAFGQTRHNILFRNPNVFYW
jgi:hypothetical protein